MTTNSIKKIVAGCFLTFGLLGFTTSAIVVVNNNSEREDLIPKVAGLIIGFPSVVLGGWLIASYIDRERKEIQTQLELQQVQLAEQIIQSESKNQAIARLESQLNSCIDWLSKPEVLNAEI